MEPLKKIICLIYEEEQMRESNEPVNSNPEAFERLINTVRVKLYKTGMAILKNDDDVCDAIQETLLSAYKNFGSLREEQYFSTWIIRIMINKCYDIIKKKQKVAYLNEKMEIEADDAYYDRYKEDSTVERVLNQINPDLKLVTVLYYYDEFSVKEISEMLNLPEGTVKSRLARARDKMYEILKMEEGERIG